MADTSISTAPSEFGSLLRRWRQIHGYSQLDLALTADSSARHISFIETGRSKPSREMVLRLCEVMELPLRERNRLLNAAGFSPAYKETALDQAGLDPVRKVLDIMLAQQEPYPATVMNRSFDILMVNHAAAKTMNTLGVPLGGMEGPPNALKLTLHPDGFKPFVKDWEKTAHHLIQRAHRQLRGTEEDDPLARVLQEVLSYPGVPKEWQFDDPTQDAPPVMPIEFEMNGIVVSFITTIASFGTPQDVTAEEIMIESMFPANEQTEQIIKAMADQ